MTRFLIAAAVAVVTATGAFADDDANDGSEPAHPLMRAALTAAFAVSGFGYLELPSFLTAEQAATLMSIMEDPTLDNSERQTRVTQLIEDAMG